MLDVESLLTHAPGIPPRALAALLGAIHSEPGIPPLPSASETTRFQYDRGNRLGAAGQSFHNPNTSAGEVPSLIQEEASQEPLEHSPTAGAEINQPRILPTRQPHGPPAALGPHEKANFGRFKPQTYPPAGSSQSTTATSEATNSSSPGTVSHTFNQAPRFPPSRMRLCLLGEASVAKSELDQSKYLGDKEGAQYKQLNIQNLPYYLNCALWLSNIPPSATPAEIFDQIDDGDVVALHINAPDESHPNSAATLVFKAPESAARFMDRGKSWVGIFVKGQRLFVRYNTRGNIRRTDDVHRTRVLVVEGVSSSPERNFSIKHY